MARQGFSIALASAAAILISKWLKPADFGVFAQISFWTIGSAAMLIGDLGLVLALVRKPTAPTEEEWTGVFSLSALFAAVGTLIAILASAILLALDRSATAMLVLLLGATASIRFFRVAPSAALQRANSFKTIALGEILESLLYYIPLLTLAYSGAGPAALAVGAICKELFGVSWVLIKAPRKFHRKFGHIGKVRPFFKIGMLQQGSAFLALLTYSFQPVVIGGLLGHAALGLSSWASNISGLPMTFLGAADRVVLVAFSRTQHDIAQLRHWVNRAIRINTMTVAPFVAILAASSHAMIVLIFDPKWLPSQPLLLATLPSILLTALSMPLLLAFNALGRTNVMFLLSVAWTVLMWVTGTILLKTMGLYGYGIAYVILQIPYFAVWVVARRDLGVNPLRAGFGPLAAGVVMAVTLRVLPAPHSGSEFIGDCFVGGIVYLAALFAFNPPAMKADVNAAVRQIRQKLGRKSPVAAGGV